VRLRSLFILIGPLIGMLATEPLKAQQDDETRYLIAGGAALGAAVTYNAYRQSPVCAANFGGDSTQFANGCTNRQQVKTLFGVAALLCAAVSVVELLRAVHLVAFRPSALITLAPHAAPALRPPNLTYDMPRREVWAVLVHAAF
jgi:hypothetical protein